MLLLQVAEELEGMGLDVITRSGSPAKPTDQHRVAAAAASTVVLLWPADTPPAEASAQTAAALSALRASGGVRGQKVVVQSRGDALAEFDATQVCAGLARGYAGPLRVKWQSATSLRSCHCGHIGHVLESVDANGHKAAGIHRHAVMRTRQHTPLKPIGAVPQSHWVFACAALFSCCAVMSCR